MLEQDGLPVDLVTRDGEVCTGWMTRTLRGGRATYVTLRAGYISAVDAVAWQPAELTGGAWYPISALRRERRRVWLSWRGRVFPGWWGRARTNGRARYWAVLPSGESEPLRNPEPDSFKPFAGEAWPDPLPEPLTPAHSMPVKSPAAAEPDAPDPIDDLEWPRPYAQPGSITRREAEIRVLRALRVQSVNAEVGVSGACGPRAYGDSALAAWAADTAEPHWEPTRRDIADELVAMAWFCQLWSWKSQDALRCRAAVPRYSWRQIGQRLKVSRERARQVYAEALDEVWAIANGGSPPRKRAPKAPGVAGTAISRPSATQGRSPRALASAAPPGPGAALSDTTSRDLQCCIRA